MKSPEDRHDCEIKVWLNVNEYAHVLKKAKRLGVPVSVLVRMWINEKNFPGMASDNTDREAAKRGA